MIKRKLLYEHKAFGPVYYHNATYWVRCSAQIWNEVSLNLECATYLMILLFVFSSLSLHDLSCSMT